MHSTQDTTICSTIIQRTAQKQTYLNTEHNAQPQRTEHSTDYLHKYSFDLYHEYVSINNSNTIELYTILQENI